MKTVIITSPKKTLLEDVPVGTPCDKGYKEVEILEYDSPITFRSAN